MASLLGYLVLEKPRQRLSHWVTALAPLGELGAPEPLRVDGYFLAGEDRALLGLWFLDNDSDARAWVEHVARLAEVPLIDPSQLADPDRRALLEKLQGSDVCIEHGATIGEVLSDLVRRGRELRAVAPARTITDRTLSAPGGASDGLAVRSAAERSPSPAAAMLAQRDAAVAVAREERRRGSDDVFAAGTARGPMVATREEIAQAESLLPSSVARGPAGTRNDLARDIERTALAAPQDPFTLAFEASAPTLEARVLRGTRWMSAQLSYLSLDRLRISTVAMPRPHDLVVVALAFSDAPLIVTGTVSYLSDELETSHTGIATFELALRLDDAERARLAALLRRARAAFAQLRPPSPRASQRFSLAWPLTLATPRGSIRAELLDTSSGGMFVAPLRELELSGAVGFSLVLDDLLSTVAGRARVVRQVPSTEARSRGVRSGVGMAIVELSEAARLSWERFVGRVRRRNARRVLACASGARLDELAQSLASAGYAVYGGVDPVSVLRLLETEPTSPDAVVLDGEWAHGPEPSWFADRLSARGIRCVTTHGDARRAWGDVDRLLGVA